MSPSDLKSTHEPVWTQNLFTIQVNNLSRLFWLCSLPCLLFPSFRGKSDIRSNTFYPFHAVIQVWLMSCECTRNLMAYTIKSTTSEWKISTTRSLSFPRDLSNSKAESSNQIMFKTMIHRMVESDIGRQTDSFLDSRQGCGLNFGIADIMSGAHLILGAS